MITCLHRLKCWPIFLSAVERGEKTAELRKDDRGFRVGDFLQLVEWVPDEERCGPRFAHRVVTHITRGGPWLGRGYVMLSMREPTTAEIRYARALIGTVGAKAAAFDTWRQP